MVKSAIHIHIRFIQQFLCTLLFLFFFNNVLAQPTKEWDKTIGGSDGDYLYALKQTNDGGYILGGTSSSPISGDKSGDKKGPSDFWIVKVNFNGTKEWDKTLGGSNAESLYSIQQTADGGYILGGVSSSGADGDKSEDTRGGTDYWIVKLSSSGIKQWDRTFGGSGYDGLNSLQQTTDGGYILGGYSNSNRGGDKSEDSRGSYDSWVIKVSSDGALEWDQTFGGVDDDQLYALQQTSDFGYVLGGSSNSNTGGEKDAPSKGDSDFWILKIDKSGKKEWDRTIGGPSMDGLRSARQTTDGGYILGGFSGGDAGGDKSENGKGAADYWVVKLNKSGIIEWDKTIGGNSQDVFTCLQQT